MALFDSKIESASLDILGRCLREETCETTGAPSGGLPQKLHMFNGDLLNSRIAESDCRLANLIESGRSPEEIVDEFYLRTLGRRPSSEEQKYWNGQLADSTTGRQEFLEDFVWSLLTCREFVTNH